MVLSLFSFVSSVSLVVESFLRSLHASGQLMPALLLQHANDGSMVGRFA
jgi:hypothetical protein